MEGSIINRFKSTPIVQFFQPSNLKRSCKSAESEYWSCLSPSVGFDESSSSPVYQIDDFKASNGCSRLAVTSGTKVNVYDTDGQTMILSLNKFKSSTLSCKFRKRDGNLLATGSEDGNVSLFRMPEVSPDSTLSPTNISSAFKNALRLFKYHKSDVRCIDFMYGGHKLVSGSDDSNVCLWDLTSETPIQTISDVHKDNVRCCYPSSYSADVLVTGCYDHKVRMWDMRTKSNQNCVLQVDHGSPVEAVLIMPNEAILISAGGDEIRVWDLMTASSNTIRQSREGSGDGGASLLNRKCNVHNKTITSLCFSDDKRVIVSSSLDCHVKFHNQNNLITPSSTSSPSSSHAIKFNGPILSCKVSNDDSWIACGLVDGLVQYMNRLDPNVMKEEREEASFRKPFEKHWNKKTSQSVLSFKPCVGNSFVKQDMIRKEAKYDYFLRKFQHTKALDEVLKTFIQRRHPEYTHSVLIELKRRNALETAIGGRDEKSLTPMLNFIIRYINDVRFTSLLIEISNTVLALYGDMIGDTSSSETLNSKFQTLVKVVDREVDYIHQLIQLEGSLKCLLSPPQSMKREVVGVNGSSLFTPNDLLAIDTHFSDMVAPNVVTLNDALHEGGKVESSSNKLSKLSLFKFVSMAL